MAVRAGFELNKYFVNKKGQPDSVLYYTPGLIEKAIALKDHFGESKGYAWMGNAHFFKRDYQNAVIWYEKGLTTAKRHGLLSLTADLYNRIGACYNNLNKQEIAIRYLIGAAKAYQQSGEDPGLAQAYYGISLAYKQQKQPAKRLYYSKQAATIAERLPSTENIKKAIIFASAATCLIETKPDDIPTLNEAKRYADMGFALCRLPNLSAYATQYYIVYSGYYYALKNYAASILNAQKGLTSAIKITDEERFNLYYRMAEGYREDKEIKLAYRYIDSAKSLSTAKNPMYAYNLAQCEYRLNKMSGESQAALTAFEKYQKLKDSILNVEKNKAINEVVEKYESELKDQKILQLEKKQLAEQLRMRTLVALCIVALLISVILIFGYRQRAIRSKLTETLAEQRLNRARMNPHFFFNMLSSLQGYILKEQDVYAAASYISKFAAIMRATLESTYQEYTTIEEDVVFLRKYIQLFLLKEDGWFEYELTYPPEMGHIELPIMIVQPFVENAIMHGFKNISHKGKLVIAYEVLEDNIRISVSDNGNGISDDVQKNKHVSRASQIIKDRLLLLGKHKNYIDLHYIPMAQGTKVVIQIPNQL